MTTKDDGSRYRPTYIAYAYIKSKRVYTTNPYDTRDEAVAACFKNAPRADRVASGYGYAGSFDVRSITRKEWETKP